MHKLLKTFCLFVLFLIISTKLCFGQGLAEKKIRYTISYFGNNVINPGISGHAEHAYKNNPVSFLSLQQASIETLASGELSMYWDPFSHSSLIMNTSYVKRFYFHPRFSIQAGAGFGFSMDMVSDVYTFKQGALKHKALDVIAYWTPEVSTGWRFSGKNDKRAIISEISIYFPLAYNLFTVPMFSYEIGIQF